MKGCLANQADLDPEWQNLIGKTRAVMWDTEKEKKKKNTKTYLEVEQI